MEITDIRKRLVGLKIVDIAQVKEDAMILLDSGQSLYCPMRSVIITAQGRRRPMGRETALTVAPVANKIG